MSALLLLKTAHSLHDIANLLAVKPAHLSFVLYKKPAVLKYTTFTIPKKYGGTRTINAPIADLKHIQSQLAALLLKCCDELSAKYGRQSSHGFATGRSILTNAHAHRGRAHVFNLDLADFFGSFNFGRVRGFFIRDNDFALDPAVATVIAQIACHNNALPQGSPASPVITNLIGNILDTRLVRLARRTDCIYTRYADDLTFSTNLSEVPKDVAVLVAGSWQVGDELQKVIAGSGFVVNASKVRMQYEDSKQMVTGLVVNRKANVPANYRATLRAMAHRLFRTGAFHHEAWIKDPLTGVLGKQSSLGEAAQLQGMFAHVEHADQFNRKIRGQSDTDAPGRHRLYRRLFFYIQFFAAPAPVILCEGKTDNVYMLHAIRARAAAFPELATIDPTSGAISLKLRLYKYVNKTAGRLLQLSGGQGELGKFVSHYLHDVGKYFRAKGAAQHPVILLVDHDEGGKGVYQSARKLMKKPFDMKMPFEHVAANLYLVATPLVGGAAESCIEEFFSPSTLSTLLGGKKLNYKTLPIDELTEYGKAYFAEHVVKANAATIDFTGFDALLDRLRQVLAHYATLPK
jgi:hypothetical protein